MAWEAASIYSTWINRLWSGDLDVAADIVADDFTGHWPEQEIRSRTELVDLIEQTRAMFSGLEFRIEVGPIAQGDLIAGRWTGAGQMNGETVRFLGNDLLRVEDDLIAEYWVASWSSA